MGIFRHLAPAASLLLMGLIAGCASSGRQSSPSAVVVPPGVDQQTAAQASRVADSNFVSVDAERRAQQEAEIGQRNLKKVDEFWKVLEQQVQQGALSQEQQASFDRELAQGAQALEKWKALTKNGTDDKAFKSAFQFCQQAQTHLENAVRINPFDKNARVLLSMAYYNLQRYFGESQNHERAISILERLIRIERGEHELYRLLGENYLALKDYRSAGENFARGQYVMIKTSFDAPPDSSLLFYYSYMQADAYARLHNAPAAVKTFKIARNFARTKQEQDDVDNYIKWINWDGGNIPASERWDEIVAMEQKKEYKKLADASLQLIPTLRTRRAKMAVHNKLAIIEFEFLDRKDDAVERMRTVHEALAPEELANPSEEVKLYLNTYGAMLHRLGVDAREAEQRKIALTYFAKAVTFNWDQVAKPLMEMVTLVWNSPDQAVGYAEKALQVGEGVLTAEEACELRSLLVKACKSAGQFDKARNYFTQWKECQARMAATN